MKNIFSAIALSMLFVFGINKSVQASCNSKTIINQNNYNVFVNDPTCVQVSEIDLNETTLENINFPFLEIVSGKIAISGAYCGDKLKNISFPALTYTSQIIITYNDLISNIDFPKLENSKKNKNQLKR